MVKSMVKRTVKKKVHSNRQKRKVSGSKHKILNKPDKKLSAVSAIFTNIRKEAHKSIVGQDTVINGILRAILADGHCLVEGVPGIAKTLIVKTLANITGCSSSRVQFTADLLPTDITGLTIYNKEKEEFSVIKGPVFANFILADEINRSPPKVQSALLEAMQEKQVTIGRTTYPLPLPFFVMATQNPFEQAGVYSLPEAQIDRFLFKLKIGYPEVEEENEILRRNMTLQDFKSFNIRGITNPQEILGLQSKVRNIYLSPEVEKYIVRIIDATRTPSKYNIPMGKYIDYGASPRGSIGLFIASKAEALMKGSSFVTPHHVKTIAHDILRHRILLNYEGQAENIDTDKIVDEVLAKVPVP